VGFKNLIYLLTCSLSMNVSDIKISFNLLSVNLILQKDRNSSAYKTGPPSGIRALFSAFPEIIRSV
jgi:hypothetical protein